MNLGQKIRSGAKWLFLGNIGSRILEFGFGIALARLLVPADFGLVATVAALTGFAGLVLSGGMGQALIQAKEVAHEDFNAVFTLQLGVGILIYVLFFVTAPLFADFFGAPIYVDLIRITGLQFLMRPFAFMRIAWLNREMDFKKRATVGIVGGLFSGLTGTMMAWAGLGVWSLTLSGVFASLFRNFLLERITPLRIRLNLDLALMRKHSSYGFKITAIDFISYLTRESINLILSKGAGPAFLGLYRKSDSLSRMPNWVIVRATMEPVFRALSKVQDDMNQTKYIFYRTITLFMAYTTPLYVMMWWIAEPFIGFVYGEKWLPAAAPMQILLCAGLFFNVLHPSNRLLNAQNRLTQRLVAQITSLTVIAAACVIGLKWGLKGVAFGILGSHVFTTSLAYFLVHRTIPTRFNELLSAAAPGLSLSGLLFIFLLVINFLLGDIRSEWPALYLLIMTVSGAAFYITAFLLLPISSLQSEAVRWRQKLSGGLSFVYKTFNSGAD